MKLILLVVALATIGGCSRSAREESPAAPGGSSSRSAPEAVHGTVDVGGTPVAGAQVTATPLSEPAPAIPEVAVFTDETGTYDWPLPPGRYRLSVHAQARTASSEVTVTGGPGPRVDLHLRP